MNKWDFSSNENIFTWACLILQCNCVTFEGYMASLQGAFMTMNAAPQNLPKLLLLL